MHATATQAAPVTARGSGNGSLVKSSMSPVEACSASSADWSSGPHSSNRLLPPFVGIGLAGSAMRLADPTAAGAVVLSDPLGPRNQGCGTYVGKSSRVVQ